MSTPIIRPRLANLRRAMSSTPWAIIEDKLLAILDVVDFHASGNGYTPEQLQTIQASVQARSARASTIAPAGSKIAVIPIYGTISQRSSLFSSMSGGCSTEDIAAALDQAMVDPNVGSIVFDIDSPGGSVSGVPELAARVFAARGQGKKLTAVANTLMASAAYWIGSACDEIVVSPSGDVGSIGVICVHTDISGADAQDGIKRTVVRSGKYKADTNPFEPLSDDARAALQQTTDDMYAMFTADVAKHRGTTTDAVQAGYGEARCLPAARAVAEGLADRVATLEDVLAELGAPNAGLSGRGMRAEAPALAAALDAADLRFAAADVPDALLAQMGLERMEPAVVGEVAEVRHIPITRAGDGAPSRDASLPANRPHVAKEHPVKEDTAAQTGADAAAIQQRIDAALQERQRANNEIAALCGEHGLDATAQADVLSKADGNVHAAAAHILNIKKQVNAGRPALRVGATREANKPWENFGEQCQAVISAFTPGRTSESPDPRLFGAAQGMNQQVPSEGGFLVAPQFSTAIWDGLNAEADSLISMTDNYTVEGESLTFNANAETSRATGSRFGGINGYWINEADQITKSKPKFRALKLEPQQLGVFVYLTEKLMRNAGVALGQYVTRAATEEINFLVGNAIYRGTGAGQPAGLLNAGSTITVNKETSQAAATLQQENISKMWARLHPRCKKNAVWLINNDVEPQLDFLNTVVKNVAGTENVGGYANKVYDAEKFTLKGRPIIRSEYCETLGTLGDIMLVDPTCYATGTRGGVESAVSMHLRFDYAEQALRFLFEADGQPWLASALTPYKGAATLTSQVILQAR